ncbi:LysM peptidoglycan-binding domain-containing protein [Ectothiorhodospiraceae bacterium WFHF3C12]|nr:LysM peptidoglycan-binding domain-containing protein [Ectothiorhodospiraceae bacterium WFHF3C12]
MRIVKLLGPILALILATALSAQDDGPLRNGHPERYTVQAGDTLWDISDRFLRDPWYWPEIWYENPDIENPHLIYPGDVIKLTTVDGERRLTVERGGGTVKLSPKIREQSLDEAINTIPIDAIRPFLSGNRVVDADTFEQAPYIIAGADERVMGSEGDPVYARRLENPEHQGFAIVREGSPFVDPETDEILGYEATYIGDAQLLNTGDPATLSIVASNREVLPGDRLLETRKDPLRSRYYPRPPTSDVDGQIVAVMDGVSEIGQFNVVAINRGAEDGLEQGHVLAVFKSGRTVTDRWSGEDEDVTLPPERAGELIIFRTFKDMSFGLIMEATRSMNVADAVRNP